MAPWNYSACWHDGTRAHNGSIAIHAHDCELFHGSRTVHRFPYEQLASVRRQDLCVLLTLGESELADQAIAGVTICCPTPEEAERVFFRLIESIDWSCQTGHISPEDQENT